MFMLEFPEIMIFFMYDVLCVYDSGSVDGDVRLLVGPPLWCEA